MITTEYNFLTNRTKHTSSYSQEKLIDFVAIDLNTNLPCAAWWAAFPAYGCVEFNLPNEYLSELCGVEINAYYEKTLVSSSKHQWKKLDNRFKFIAPKTELAFGSWHSLVYQNEYESKFSSNDVVYDLGANFGVYTMWANHHNVKQIYAFEPTPKNVSCLKETFEFDNNVTIFSKAIGGENKKITFYLTDYSVGNSAYATEGIPLEVDCINLEHFIQENNLEKPTIIKCDIEGSEYEFIHSLSDNFFETVHTFIVEFHNNYNKEVWNIVEKLLNLGYSIKMTPNNKIDAGMSTFVAKK